MLRYIAQIVGMVALVGAFVLTPFLTGLVERHGEMMVLYSGVGYVGFFLSLFLWGRRPWED